MWGKRLKEKVRWNQQGSPFAAWTAILLVLMATLSVFVALSDKRFFTADPSPPRRFDCFDERVTITASGGHTYYWNDTGPFPIEKIRSDLAEFLKEAIQPNISITGDKSASFGDTVHLVDEVRRQGVKKVQIVPQARAMP